MYHQSYLFDTSTCVASDVRHKTGVLSGAEGCAEGPLKLQSHDSKDWHKRDFFRVLRGGVDCLVLNSEI